MASGFVDIKNASEMWNECHLWSDKPMLWPDLSFGYPWIYLVDKQWPSSAEKLKCYKSLDAYEYFVSRKVGVVYSYEVWKDAGVFYSKVKYGQVKPSLRPRICAGWLRKAVVK